MAVNKDDFIAIGTLAKPKDASEIELRSAIRNLYYGIFHGARELEDTLPRHSKGAVRQGSHDILAGFYKDYPVNNSPVSQEFAYKLRGLGIMLDTLKSKRHRADYSLDDDIGVEEYLLQGENTEKAQSLLEQIISLAEQELG